MFPTCRVLGQRSKRLSSVISICPLIGQKVLPRKSLWNGVKNIARATMRLIGPKEHTRLPRSFISFYFSSCSFLSFFLLPPCKRSFGIECDGCESISLVNVACLRPAVYTACPGPLFVRRDTYEAWQNAADLKELYVLSRGNIWTTFVANESWRRPGQFPPWKEYSQWPFRGSSFIFKRAPARAAASAPRSTYPADVRRAIMNNRAMNKRGLTVGENTFVIPGPRTYHSFQFLYHGPRISDRRHCQPSFKIHGRQVPYRFCNTPTFHLAVLNGLLRNSCFRAVTYFAISRAISYAVNYRWPTVAPRWQQLFLPLRYSITTNYMWLSDILSRTSHRSRRGSPVTWFSRFLFGAIYFPQSQQGI